MGSKSAPKPPDLTPFVNATMQNAQTSERVAAEQLAWAREQDAANRAVLERVLAVQLPAMEEQATNARTDRARYENVYQPIEDNLVADFQSYGSPDRFALERGRAIADVSASFDAQRRNALQRLESYGVDPSQTRNAALDIGVRAQQAAAEATAANNATRNVEDKGRALRADAINIGRGMPSQVAGSYGQAVAAGQAGVGGANQTAATGGANMGNPTAWSGMASQGYGQGANITNSGFNNQMGAYNAQQQANASLMSGVGGLAGMAMMMADGGDIPPRRAIPFEDSAPGEIDDGPTDGSGIDDQVPIMASVDEYIIPADVVRKKGVEFFDKLVEKYHTPAAKQRTEMRRALPA